MNEQKIDLKFREISVIQFYITTTIKYKTKH